jgi:hypothetical protein
MIVLARQFDTQVQGMFGRLFLHGGMTLWTLEPSWMDNSRGRSCIPAGIYRLERGSFQGRYSNFSLEGVPDRSAIEIHVGNTALADTTGCILVGVSVGVLGDQWAVLNSREAMDLMMDSLRECDSERILVLDPDSGVGRGSLL